MPMRTVISTIYVVCIEMEVDHAFIKKKKKQQQLTFCFWAYTETIFLKTKIFILQLSLLSVLY